MMWKVLMLLEKQLELFLQMLTQFLLKKVQILKLDDANYERKVYVLNRKFNLIRVNK